MWTCRDWAVAGTSALGVFGMSLALFWGSPLDAGNEKAITQPVAVPTYTVGDCRITAQVVAGDAVLAKAEGTPAGLTSIKPGSMPVVQLVVLNTTDAPANAAFHVELQHRSMADAFRRVPRPMPPEWSDDYDLSLKPGEKRILALAVDKVKPAAMDTLTLAVGPRTQAVAVTNNVAQPLAAAAQVRVQLLTLTVAAPKPAQAAATPETPALADAGRSQR